MMYIPWSPTEDKLLRILRPTCKLKEISQVLELLGFIRSPGAIKKRAKLLDVRLVAIGNPVLEGLEETETDAVDKILAFREPVPEPIIPTSQKSALTTLQRQTTIQLFTDLQEIRKVVSRSSSSIQQRITHMSDKESAVVVLSDIHMGKVIREVEQVLYNVEIAAARLKTIAGKIEQAIETRDVDEVVLVLAGDLVDGEGIYPGQEMSLELNVADQVKLMTSLLWDIVRQLSSKYKVRIITCRGNHGRSGLSDEANWDNIIYQQLEILADLQASEDITIRNVYGNHNVFEVKGWTGLTRHSAPPQADTPSAISKFAGWYSIHKWDLICYGHYHHWGIMTWNGRPIFRNGSTVSGDDYAEQFGARDDPTQLLFCLSKNKLPTCIVPLTF